MAGDVSDEAFARAAQQGGVVSYDDLEAARAVQAESAKKGVIVALAEVLIQQGVITTKQRETVEQKVAAQQAGGLMQLGPYKLLRKLGEGGMGAVYLADDLNVGRKVAVKVLAKKHAADHDFLTRFRREAQATGKLNHVNIVGAYMVGEHLGRHYYAMEYCDGESLDRILKREKLIPWDAGAGIVIQVARGLKHAHDHGIIHRDIKPANIVICKPLDGAGCQPADEQQADSLRHESFVAKILDLGLSKALGGDSSFYTQTGVALGTPHYISPEQARGDRTIDGRADIYSLGATFYHLITGMTPFEGSTAAVIMTKHINEALTNPQDIVEDIPDGVAHVIMKMMAKEPADRYRDCKELLDDLELVTDGKMPSSRAIDVGKSSVAMRRVVQAAQPAGRKPAKAQQARQPAPPREPELVPIDVPPNRKPLYIGASVVALAAVVLGVALSMSGGGDKSGNQAVSAASTPDTEAAAKLRAEKPRLKDEAARLEEERHKLAEDKRKAEEARLAAEAAAKKKAEEAAKTQAVTAPLATTDPPPTTKVEPPPAQPDTKVAQPDTKTTHPDTTVADDRSGKALQAFSAVLEETAPLLAQNKFADAIALLERKAKDPTLADGTELLKQEKADVESVVELRKAAIEALRRKAGQQVTLKKGGTEFKGKVVAEPKPDLVTLGMGGAQMTFNAMQLSLEDVDEYAPRMRSVGADLRGRGIMYLAAGNVAKAKEYFSKPQTLNPEPYLDRIAALELGEIEAAALKAWERAEKLFAAKEMKGAKAAYEAFERDHGKTQTAAKQAAALKERYDAIEKVLGPAPELTLNLGGGVKIELVLVKAGEFMMGVDDGEGCEKPIHKVKISQPYYIGKYDVTVAQFRAFATAMKFHTEAEKCDRGWTVSGRDWRELPGINWRNPGFKQDDSHPVCVVS